MRVLFGDGAAAAKGGGAVTPHSIEIACFSRDGEERHIQHT